MQLIAQKSSLNGRVRIPGSKSHTIRAVAIASLADGISYIRCPLTSSDTISAVECYRALGADINTSDPTCWIVKGTAGKLTTPADPIDVANSGTTLRIAAGSAALIDGGDKVTLTGDDQIKSRPIGPLLKSLNQLGAKCRSLSGNDNAPVEIAGTLRGGKTQIEAKSSQYLTSLLLACPLAESETVIDVPLLYEPGYVQMTLDWLDRQKIEYKKDGLTHFVIRGEQRYTAFDWHIPADFSSATFFLCAGSLFADELIIEGLDFTDSQPDKSVIEYLRLMGADIAISEAQVLVKRSDLCGIEIDMNDTPDALPAMAVTAMFAKGQTRLVNVAQARSKETDRISCMASELSKMGIEVEELPDGLIVNSGTPSAAKIKGWGDHRIVMALAIAAMGIENGQCVIDTAEAMNVTFPEYVALMQSVGAHLALQA